MLLMWPFILIGGIIFLIEENSDFWDNLQMIIDKTPFIEKLYNTIQKWKHTKTYTICGYKIKCDGRKRGKR